MPVYEYQGKHYDLSETDPSAAKAKIQSYLSTQQPKATEEASGGLVTAGKEAVMAAPSGAVGGLSALGAAGAIAAIPAVAAASPIAAGAAVVGGALAAGFGGSAVAQEAFNGITHMEGMQEFLSKFGLDDKTRARDIAANPKSAFAGSLVGSTLAGGMRPGFAGKAPAALGAGLMTGIEGGRQLSEGKFDPAELVMSAAAGALTKPTALANKVQAAVEGKATQRFQPKETPSEPMPTDPAQLEKWRSRSPIDQTAIRNKETGEIELMGPKHDEARKAETKDTHEQGFMTKDGRFLTRQEALEQAKRSGQVPEDVKLEFPDEGLHSGDLFKANKDDPRWHTEERMKTAEPPKEEVPSNKEEPKPTESLSQEAKEVVKEEKDSPLADMHKRGFEHDDGIAAAKTVPELVQAIKAKLGEDHYVSTVLDALGKHFTGVVDPVHILGRQAMAAANKAANVSENAPGMHNVNGVHLELGKGTNAIVAAHEIAHSYLAAKIEAIRALPENHPDKVALQKLVSDIEGLLKHAVDNADAKSMPKDIFRHFDYATENIHEFISEGLFNPKVMRELMKLDMGKAKGFVAKIIEKVADFFGMDPKQKTAFSELLRMSQKLADAKVDGTSYKLGKGYPSEQVDPKSISSPEEFDKHAQAIYDTYGAEAAERFVRDWNLSRKEQTIPIPNDNKSLDDALHKIDTFGTKDLSELTTLSRNLKKELGDQAYEAIASGLAMHKDRTGSYDGFVFGELPKEQIQKMVDVLNNRQSEAKGLIAKIKSLGGEVGREFSETSQSRIMIGKKKQGNKPGEEGFEENTVWSKLKDILTKDASPFGVKLAEEAGAAIDRSVFQTSDGRVIELHRQQKDTKVPVKHSGIPVAGEFREIKKGTEIWLWEGGKKRQIGHSDDLKFGLGDTFKQFGKEIKVVDGKIEAIEKESPYRYLKNADVSSAMALMGLRKMARDLEFIESLKKSKYFNEVAVPPETPVNKLPAGWVQPASIDKIPQLRGWYMDPKTAAVVEDFAKVWDNNLYSKFTNAIVKNLMLNPLPHMFNEAMHLYNARGLFAWIPGTGGWSRLAKTGNEAYRDVATQSQFYRDIMREGGSILSADPLNKYFSDIIEKAREQYRKDPGMDSAMLSLAKKLGMPVAELYNGISKKSQQAMWFTRDVMYVQYIRETMSKNPGMDLKGAIEQVERHMPNYRIPSEVMGSRKLAQFLKNPHVTLFSRYHYGMVRSIAETLKDLNPRNLKTPEGQKHFKEGVDTALAIGFAFAALYPIMDEMASAMFGEGSKQRRAGPYHLMGAAGEVASGERDASALVWPVLTFNPVLINLMQLGLNKNMFTGKPIYHPDDTASQKASDLAYYGAKQIPQVSPLMGSGPGNWLARQADIKAKTPEQRAKERKAREYEARNKKARDRKRQQGTYTP